MRWDAAAELRYDALIAEGAHRVPGARRLPTSRAGIAAEDLARRLASWRRGADPRAGMLPAAARAAIEREMAVDLAQARALAKAGEGAGRMAVWR